MAFCGQCGFLLPPKVKTCPRCGTEVTPNLEVEELNPNAQTMIHLDNRTLGAATHAARPDLTQEPTQFSGYNTETTQAEPTGNRLTPPPVSSPSGPNYSQSGFSQPASPSSSGANFFPTQAVSYPNYTPPAPVHIPVPPRKKGRGGIILLTLLVLLLIIGTAVIFILGPEEILRTITHLGGNPGAIATTPVYQPTPTATTPPTMTPQQHAQQVIENYYAAINDKDYQTAYNLWVKNPQSYNEFAQGFANTSHDEVTFGNIILENDGTIQVNITLTATATSAQKNVFGGYYLVGQQADGTWKITTAKIHQVS